MSRPKYVSSTLSGLVDSDSDDTRYVEADAMRTPDSGVENMPAAKKGRGKAKATITKITKSKAPTRRVSGRITTGQKAKRAPLSDKTNKQNNASDTEEVDEFEQQDTVIGDVVSDDELESSVVAIKQQKPRTTKSKVVAKAVKNVSNRTSHSTSKATTRTPQSKIRVNAASKNQTRRPIPEEEIHETQESLMDIADDGNEEVEEPTLKPVSRHAATGRSTSQSRQMSVPRRRAGSASDTERNDPAVRRKLGEMTKKFENLDLKYRNLREIGIKEAEHNFERLKKQSEESSKVANKLITSLKAEIVAQKGLNKESQELKKTVASQTSEIEKLKTEVARLTSSLSESYAENKTLSAKLAANRNAASSVESTNSKTPGSAMKANGGIRMMGSVEAAQQVQAGQLKEDLYGDLTGLIIRSVKREPEEDVYDCIQTGRNGTLHFKLGCANEKCAESFDDAQCVYIPLLDPPRDKELMELLPDYLIDEITFPRQQAAKFYSRISEALTKKQG